MVTAFILLDRCPTARSRTPLRRLCNGTHTHFLTSTILSSPIIVLQARLTFMPGFLMHNAMLCTAGHAYENRVIRFMNLAGRTGVIQAPAKVWDCAEGGTRGEIIVTFELRFGGDRTHVSV